MSDTTTLLSRLLASVTITSMLISFFVLAVYGYSVLPFDIGSIDVGLSAENSETNFQSNCSYSEYEITGSVTCTPIGLSLSNGGLYFPLTDAEKKKGVHTNSYHIIPEGGDYDIIIFQNAAGIHALSVRSDGLHLYLANFFGVIITDNLYVPLEGANRMEARITTEYDQITPKTKFTFNGQSYELKRENTPTLGFLGAEYFGGVVTGGQMIIPSLSRNYVQQQSVTDGLALVLGFLLNVIALLTWSIDPNVFPWMLNLIFIKTQIIGIFVCIISIARGGS